MDVAAAAATATADIPALVTHEAHDTQFEDALRQEVLLVPEDMEDIHIQATPLTALTAVADPATDATATDAATATDDEVVEDGAVLFKIIFQK